MHSTFSHNSLRLSKLETRFLPAVSNNGKSSVSKSQRTLLEKQLASHRQNPSNLAIPEKQSHLGEPVQPSSCPTPLYAIIIGIGRYELPGLPPLRGASTDVDAVHSFLTRVIGVPTDQIEILLDEAASRANIISALKALANDKRIQYGDAILIYFAGHGTEVCVERDNEVAKLPALLSRDFNGYDVHPITENTLEALIAGIHSEKGDNITLMLDCGYSEPAVPTANAAICTARGVTLKDSYVVPYDLDSEQRITSNTRSIGFVLAESGPRTHVLLGACMPCEYALEYNDGGMFTTAILKLLASDDFNEISYAKVAGQLELPGQTIQCEGVNMDGPIFGGKLATEAVTYKAKLTDAVSCVIHAGMIHDVAVGARFDLYSHSAAVGRLSPETTAVVHSTGPFESILRMPSALPPSFAFGETFVAAQAKLQVANKNAQTPRLYLGSGEELDLVRRTLVDLELSSGEQTFHLVNDRSKAQLEISSIQENGATMLMLEIYDDLILVHHFTNPRTKVPPTAKNVTRLLKTTAHFFRQLHSSFINPDIRDNVQIEFRELRGRTKKSLVVGDDLLRDGQLSLETNRTKRALHGIRLVNNTDTDLYLHALYFDCSQLSIMHYYGKARPNGRRDGAPLPARSDLTLGYGSEPASALSFFVPPGRSDDLGFFKFIFTTRPIDLGNISCPSPFEDSLPSQSVSPRNTSSAPWQQVHPQADYVGTILVPIIVRDSAPIE